MSQLLFVYVYFRKMKCVNFYLRVHTFMERCLRKDVVYLKIITDYYNECGPGSVVGIATGYGFDGPGIESRWERDFPQSSKSALGPTYTMGTESFPG